MIGVEKSPGGDTIVIEERPGGDEEETGGDTASLPPGGDPRSGGSTFRNKAIKVLKKVKKGLESLLQYKKKTPLIDASHWVKIEMESKTPYPFLVCHCSTDTKCAGTNNVNIMAEADSLKTTGAEHLSLYQVKLDDGSLSKHHRYFCGTCGSSMYAHHQSYPESIYPFASCIDTPLPKVEEKDQIHMFTSSKLSHVVIPASVAQDARFEKYPNVSLKSWHENHGCFGTL
ncbi:MAG: hypothetical protein SGCHY_005513 [Lobulomycetales sp.]